MEFSYTSREESNGITQVLLFELFTYSCGKLYWKKKLSPKSRFKIGDEAGGKNDKRKDIYIRVKIKGSFYNRNRLIFLFHKGYLPEFIDHIDTIKTNDEIENLRECTGSQNQCNKKLSKANKTGIKGVRLISTNINLPYQARVVFDKKLILNKCFEKIEDAEKACVNAREKYHGEFVNHGI